MLDKMVFDPYTILIKYESAKLVIIVSKTIWIIFPEGAKWRFFVFKYRKEYV